MAVTVAGTQITFNDGTTQSTAYPGIAGNLAIGSICVLYDFSSSRVTQGTNVSGASIGYATGFSGSNPLNQPAFSQYAAVRGGNVTSPGTGFSITSLNTTAVPGTWRTLCSYGNRVYTTLGCDAVTLPSVFIAVRIA